MNYRLIILQKNNLLEVFIVVNDFDILVLGKTHLTSQTDEDDLEIDGYSIAVYYTSDLPIIFKPELTKLPESLTLQVKLGNKKCFFTCFYMLCAFVAVLNGRVLLSWDSETEANRIFFFMNKLCSPTFLFFLTQAALINSGKCLTDNLL